MSENKGDLIRRDAALKELSGLCETWEDEDCTSYQAMDIVGNLPAVDAQPVVHGEWINFRYYHDDCCKADCSNCLETTIMDYCIPISGYMQCRFCGAKMDGGDTHV